MSSRVSTQYWYQRNQLVIQSDQYFIIVVTAVTEKWNEFISCPKRCINVYDTEISYVQTQTPQLPLIHKLTINKQKLVLNHSIGVRSSTNSELMLNSPTEQPRERTLSSTQELV
ncbi:Hypothetical_protein [Hexamita inflata]|uniref:Hypothetical_protein n=1 Tax=Hexamita inflata TaxID=28002 RepID=A0ABP1I9N0_9EUKA